MSSYIFLILLLIKNQYHRCSLNIRLEHRNLYRSVHICDAPCIDVCLYASVIIQQKNVILSVSAPFSGRTPSTHQMSPSFISVSRSTCSPVFQFHRPELPWLPFYTIPVSSLSVCICWSLPCLGYNNQLGQINSRTFIFISCVPFNSSEESYTYPIQMM